MAAVIGSLRAELSATIAQFKKDLGKAADSVKAMSREFGRAGKDVKVAGDQMQRIGTALTKTLTLPLAAIGLAATAAAKEFDEAFDAIRAGTGATGQELEGLKDSFSTVFAAVPNAARDVADAITAISARTGAVGADLEQLATQIANLARLTGANVQDLAASTTRAFGDWSIATDDQAASLDFLFRTSQMTGIGIQRLSDLVVQFGAPMRALGFSFQQTAGLMGKFEEEGVNLETVMSGLRFALGKFAEAGKDPSTAFAEVTARIKAAKTESEATAIAFTTFGKRAAIDMSRAIIEGRFEIDALVQSLQTSQETINGAAQATLNFSERFEILRHRLLEALKPLGESLLKVLDDLQPRFEAIIRVMGSLVEAFGRLPGSVQTAVIVLAGVAAAIGPIAFVAGQAVSAMGSLALAFGKTGLATKTIIGSIGALKGAILALRSIDIGTGALSVLTAGGAAGGIGLGLAGMYLLAGTLADNFKEKLEAQAAAAKKAGTPIEGIRKGLLSLAKAEEEAAGYALTLYDGLEVTLSKETREKIATFGIETQSFADRLKAANAEIAALSATMRRDLTIALESGAFEMKELQEQSGLSEIALKLFQDRVQATAKSTKDAAEDWDKFNASVTRFGNQARRSVAPLETFQDVIDGTMQLNEDFSYTLMASQIEVDSLGHAVKVNLQPSLHGLTKTFDEGVDTTKKWHDGLGDLAQSFANLSQIAGGAFGSVARAIGTAVASMQLAIQSIAKIKEGLASIASGNRTRGLIQVAGGVVGGIGAVAESTGSGGIASRAGKGALTGAALGAEIGTYIIPGLGTAAGAVIGAVAGAIAGIWRGIAAKIRKEMQVNPIRAAWFDEPGHALEQLNPIVLELTGNLGAVQSVFDARNPEQYASAIEHLTAILEVGKQRFADLQGAIGGVAERLSGVTIITPEIEAALATVWDQSTTDGYLSAVRELNGLLEAQGAQYRDIEETLKKYEIDFTSAGTAFKQAKLNELAVDLRKDFDTLRVAGVDINLQMRKMGPSIRDFIKDAQAAGAEVPESMRQIIQTAIDAGEVFDRSTQKIGKNGEALEANGDKWDDQRHKITDINQLNLTFGTTMERAMQTVGTAVDRLNTILEGLAKFLGIELPKAAEKGADGIQAALDGIDPPDLTVHVTRDTSDFPTSGGYTPDVEGAAGGARVMPWGLQRLAHGGFARGTDTVPAMLTPGELVLNAAQQGNIAAAVSRTPSVVVHLTINVDGVLSDSDLVRTVQQRILPILNSTWEDNIAGSRTQTQDVLGVP